MQILAPVPVAPPIRTLSVVTSTYIGEHTVRKSVGKLTTIYEGIEVVDRYITLDSTVSTTVNDNMLVFVLSTDGAVTVSIDGMSVVPVSQFLMVDQGNTSLIITNVSTSPATLHLTYLVGAPIVVNGNADFTFDYVSGVFWPPADVTFTDTSTNSPTSWHWDFGDGAVSTLQNPTHTYQAIGTYTVTLTANGSVKQKPVQVYTLAGITSNTTIGISPMVVNFTDSSIGAPTAWRWDFGDGATSTLQNPTHTFTSSGTYSVTLYAIDVLNPDPNVPYDTYSSSCAILIYVDTTP